MQIHKEIYEHTNKCMEIHTQIKVLSISIKYTNISTTYNTTYNTTY